MINFTGSHNKHKPLPGHWKICWGFFTALSTCCNNCLRSAEKIRKVHFQWTSVRKKEKASTWSSCNSATLTSLSYGFSGLRFLQVAKKLEPFFFFFPWCIFSLLVGWGVFWQSLRPAPGPPPTVVHSHRKKRFNFIIFVTSLLWKGLKNMEKLDARWDDKHKNRIET